MWFADVVSATIDAVSDTLIASVNVDNDSEIAPANQWVNANQDDASRTAMTMACLLNNQPQQLLPPVLPRAMVVRDVLTQLGLGQVDALLTTQEKRQYGESISL